MDIHAEVMPLIHSKYSGSAGLGVDRIERVSDELLLSDRQHGRSSGGGDHCLGVPPGLNS